MATIYCTFNKTVGWRVVKSVYDTTPKIGIDNIGVPVLRIPVAFQVPRGRFCNPAKLVLSYLRFERIETMLKLPADVDREALLKFVVPINSSEPDYYQFGMNARLVCGDDHGAAQRVFADSGTDKQEDADMFWNGYLYGIERIIDDINTINQGVPHES